METFKKFKLACIAELRHARSPPDEPFYRRAVSELQEVEETINLAVEEIQADLEELGFTPEKVNQLIGRRSKTTYPSISGDSPKPASEAKFTSTSNSLRCSPKVPGTVQTLHSKVVIQAPPYSITTAKLLRTCHPQTENQREVRSCIMHTHDMGLRLLQ
ncbi:hypothetical protein TNCV_4937911 [Trichonephila clavipes]|nr:hypothetical protein TNCV_4937911 [Trichonephila clavipes]